MPPDFRPLLAALADTTPAPGGGYAAALTAGAAAALVEMAARFTLGRADHARQHDRMQTIAERAAQLQQTATEAAERDLHAYEPVLAALRRAQDDAGRAEAIQTALDQAAEPPLAVARAAAETAELALECTRTATTHLRGDALAALSLAHGACYAAAGLTAINLKDRRDDPRHAELTSLTARADQARAQAD